MYNPQGCPELYQFTEPIHIHIPANPQQNPGKQAGQVLSPVLWLKKQAWSFSMMAGKRLPLEQLGS